MGRLYVLFPHQLLLEGAKFVEGKVVSGHVVNGGWEFKSDGITDRALTAQGHERTSWPARKQTVLPVPDGVELDGYKSIMDWADAQLEIKNERM